MAPRSDAGTGGPSSGGLRTERLHRLFLLLLLLLSVPSPAEQPVHHPGSLPAPRLAGHAAGRGGGTAPRPWQRQREGEGGGRSLPDPGEGLTAAGRATKAPRAFWGGRGRWSPRRVGCGKGVLRCSPRLPAVTPCSSSVGIWERGVLPPHRPFPASFLWA